MASIVKSIFSSSSAQVFIDPSYVKKLNNATVDFGSRFVGNELRTSPYKSTCCASFAVISTCAAILAGHDNEKNQKQMLKKLGFLRDTALKVTPTSSTDQKAQTQSEEKEKQSLTSKTASQDYTFKQEVTENSEAEQKELSTQNLIDLVMESNATVNRLISREKRSFSTPPYVLSSNIFVVHMPEKEIGQQFKKVMQEKFNALTLHYPSAEQLAKCIQDKIQDNQFKIAARDVAEIAKLTSVVNVFFFEALWKTEFTNTETLPFICMDGSTLPATAMSVFLKGVSFFRDDRFMVLKLPYRDAPNLHYVLFIPYDPQDLQELSGKINSQDFLEYCNKKFQTLNVNLTFPKQALNKKTDLLACLRALDFPVDGYLRNISDEVVIQNAEQLIRGELNEKGTKIVAVTSYSVAKGAVDNTAYHVSAMMPFIGCIFSENDRQDNSYYQKEKKPERGTTELLRTAIVDGTFLETKGKSVAAKVPFKSKSYDQRDAREILAKDDNLQTIVNAASHMIKDSGQPQSYWECTTSSGIDLSVLNYTNRQVTFNANRNLLMDGRLIFWYITEYQGGVVDFHPAIFTEDSCQIVIFEWRDKICMVTKDIADSNPPSRFTELSYNPIDVQINKHAL